MNAVRNTLTACIRFATPDSRPHYVHALACVNACAEAGISNPKAIPDAIAALRNAYAELDQYCQWHHKHAGGCSMEVEQARDDCAAALAALADKGE